MQGSCMPMATNWKDPWVWFVIAPPISVNPSWWPIAGALRRKWCANAVQSAAAAMNCAMTTTLFLATILYGSLDTIACSIPLETSLAISFPIAETQQMTHAGHMVGGYGYWWDSRVGGVPESTSLYARFCAPPNQYIWYLNIWMRFLVVRSRVSVFSTIIINLHNLHNGSTLWSELCQWMCVHHKIENLKPLLDSLSPRSNEMLCRCAGDEKERIIRASQRLVDQQSKFTIRSISVYL